MRRVKKDWSMLLFGTINNGGAEGERDDLDLREKDFDPVTLALGLIDAEGGESLASFLRLKEDLEKAISGTLNAAPSAYRAFELSISAYNASLVNLAAGQKKVAEMKKGLGNVRDKLEGKGREGLVGIYNRMSHLEEMIKIMDEM